MKDVDDVIPKSVRGSEAYKYMKARKKEAQQRIDEAAKHGATLEEALRYASTPLRAALLGKRIYEAELLLEGRLEEEQSRKEESRSPEDEAAEDASSQSLAERLWGEGHDE